MTGTSEPTVAEVSADAAALDRFVLDGEAAVRRLLMIAQRIDGRRATTAVALGGQPSLVAELADLAAELAMSNRFVGEIVAALATPMPTGDLKAIRGWLADDWRGVTEHDLNRVRDRLAAADGREADWLIGSLTTAERRRLIDNVESTGFWSDDWSDETRAEFYRMIGEKVSLRTWTMIGTLTESVDPHPATAIPDVARNDGDEARAAWYEALTYGDFTDRPLAMAGSDDHRVSFDDPKQGGIGDCYLIAALIAVANADPETIDQMITANTNGTYTVTFGDGAEQVVSPTFPVHPDAPTVPVFNTIGRSSEKNEIWPALIEKAYAQRHGSWGEIVGGWPGEAVAELTGYENHKLEPDELRIDDLKARHDRGDIMTIATISRAGHEPDEWLDLETTPAPFKIPGDQGLKPRHAFVVTAVDDRASTVTLVNPWYPYRPPIELGLHDLIDSIQVLEANPIA